MLTTFNITEINSSIKETKTATDIPHTSIWRNQSSITWKPSSLHYPCFVQNLFQNPSDSFLRSGNIFQLAVYSSCMCRVGCFWQSRVQMYQWNISSDTDILWCILKQTKNIKLFLGGLKSWRFVCHFRRSASQSSFWWEERNWNIQSRDW